MVLKIFPVSESIFKIAVKRVKSKHKTSKNHGKENGPFVNIDNSSAKGDLKRSKMLVDWKNIRNSSKGEDDCDGVETFGD